MSSFGKSRLTFCSNMDDSSRYAAPQPFPLIWREGESDEDSDGNAQEVSDFHTDHGTTNGHSTGNDPSDQDSEDSEYYGPSNQE